MSSCTQELVLIERNNQLRQFSDGENLLHLQPLIIPYISVEHTYQ